MVKFTAIGFLLASSAVSAFDFSSITGNLEGAPSGFDEWNVEKMREAPARAQFLGDDGEVCRTVGSMNEEIVPDAALTSKPLAKVVCKGGSRRARARHLKAAAASSSSGPIVLTYPTGGAVKDQVITFTGTITGLDAGTQPSIVILSKDGTLTEDPIDKIDEDGYFEESVTGLEPDSNYDWKVKAMVGGVEVESETIKFNSQPTKGDDTTTTAAEDEEDIVVRASTGTGGDSRAAEWTKGGADGAVGKIYYTMGGQPYTCSGTVITDNKSGRSLIMTAAHCIYDDLSGEFAKNVLFVPNEKDYGASSSSGTCADDPCGCWWVSGGIVHEEFKTLGPFPGNKEYDYGFFVVEDADARHQGEKCNGSTFLDVAITELDVDLDPEVDVGQSVSALGYSSGSVGIRYCAESVTVDSNHPTSRLLPECALLDGASGGPWLRDVDANGFGSVVSVNSYGYRSKPGMLGPVLDPSLTRCLANTAREYDVATLDSIDGDFASCSDRGCSDEASGRRLRGNKRCRD